MIHLENHPCVLFKNGIVKMIVAMANHDETFIEHQMLPQWECDSFVWSCEYGPAFIGGDLVQGRFRPPCPDDGYVWDNAAWLWRPASEKPADTETNVYSWNAETRSWDAILRSELRAYNPE